MHARLVGTAIVVFAASFAAPPAKACSCGDAGSAEEALVGMDLVFAGTVVGQADECDPACYVRAYSADWGYVSTTFAATRVWKGDVRSTQTVSQLVDTCNALTYAVDAGEVVVLARRVVDAGYYTTNTCLPRVSVARAIELYGDAGTATVGDDGTWCPTDASTEPLPGFDPPYGCPYDAGVVDAGAAAADAGEPAPTVDDDAGVAPSPSDAGADPADVGEPDEDDAGTAPPGDDPGCAATSTSRGVPAGLVVLTLAASLLRRRRYDGSSSASSAHRA